MPEREKCFETIFTNLDQFHLNARTATAHDIRHLFNGLQLNRNRY